MYRRQIPTPARGRRLIFGSNLCACPTCGEEFRSPDGFDRHRRGLTETRRCLTPDEMRRAGMRRNAEGWWVTR